MFRGLIISRCRECYRHCFAIQAIHVGGRTFHPVDLTTDSVRNLIKSLGKFCVKSVLRVKCTAFSEITETDGVGGCRYKADSNESPYMLLCCDSVEGQAYLQLS